jgi:mannose-6-phosphate isomerase-like protein (cupin superfamily)
MAKAGDELENPVTGERIEFRQTAAETDGEVLEYDLFFQPQGFLVREHLHPSQDERHEIISGRLGLHMEGADEVLEPNEPVVVRAGTPHRLYPVGAGQVHALFELRPALRTEQLLETFSRLAQAGKVDSKGNPRPFELALIARTFEPEGYATRPPLAVQRALLGPLAALARLTGRHLP